MNGADMTGESLCAIFVDMGTSNTRAWLMRGSEILARARKPVGVSSSARDGSSVQIRSALKESIATLLEQRTEPSAVPVCVVAAGMIGSSQGLVEVAHVKAPAGVEEIASAARWLEAPELTDLPILLIPGVRTGPTAPGFESPGRQRRTPGPTTGGNKHGLAAEETRGREFVPETSDVMRGEETLCIGLGALGLISTPSVLINLGSHWKAIQLNAEGQIQASITSLSGELLQAARTETILASSVSGEWPDEIQYDWLEAGMKQKRHSGLSRTLFCVRLMALAGEGTPADRFSFLAGAFIGDDLAAFVASGLLTPSAKVAISGSQVTASAWQQALFAESISAVALTAEDSERGLLTGLRAVLKHAARAPSTVDYA